MDCQTLGKGSFARVELATHGVTGCKVGILVTKVTKGKRTNSNPMTTKQHMSF
jgi:hypothetical protein